MSDDRPDPRDDDLLRQALRSEAEGIEADRDLLDRIHGAPAPKPNRRPVLILAAAAAAIAVVAGGLALRAADGEDESLIVDQPDGTTTSTTACVEDPVANPPCGDATVGDAERPSLLVYVREDGWIVTRDLVTGDEHEIVTEGDPRDTDVEGVGSFGIDDVELSPDGRWIYYSTCCEPAVGETKRISIDGGEPEIVGYGYAPRVSPDGRFVAVLGIEAVWVYAAEEIQADPGEPFTERMAELSVPSSPVQLAWSPSGTRLAYVEASDGLVTRRVVRWDGSTFTPDPAFLPDHDAAVLAWNPLEQLTTFTSAEVEDDRGAATDPSGRWLLRIDRDGVVRYVDWEEFPRHRLLADDLPPVVDADW